MDKQQVLAEITRATRGTLIDHLGIEFIDVGEHSLTGRMPVTTHTRQPMGFLHGGASMVLAETLASVAGTLELDRDRQYCVGMEINANHVKSARDGYVTGVASAIHLGKKTQIWQIHIRDEAGRLICVSRMTLAVMNRKRHEH
ncbi:MAG: hotdog fold thioesterase [Candidatus Neomarinimicrobiota bacterium]|nr:MAG: hotdog fold thioesterase [Candidatus Neomarinimicrobiota bacterium]